MACNTCAKSFSLLRPEKGCPSCGFSFCSKCLTHKIFLKKINSDVKVCVKCSRTANLNEVKISPPDVYYKRLNANDPVSKEGSSNDVDKEIYNRLNKLKENKQECFVNDSTCDIRARLQKLKGDIPSTSDSELAARLANLKGVQNLPTELTLSKSVKLAPELRTEQEQADDLLNKYVEQCNLDSKYKDEFDGLVANIANRLQRLKGSSTCQEEKVETLPDHDQAINDEDELNKIIEEVCKIESEISDTAGDELPFCEICNEDADMRCLGCKYLFCKRCFVEHRDEEDDCASYEPYKAPKSID